MRREIIVSLVVFAGALALYFSLSLMEDPRAVIFPRVIIVIIGVLGLILFGQALMMGKEMAGKASGFRLGAFLICFVLIVIYLAVMETLGFYVSAFLFYVAVTFVMGSGDLTPKKGGMRVLSAAVFVTILYFLFNRLLAVQTPKGLLF